MPIFWKLPLAVVLAVFGVGAFEGGLLGWTFGGSLFVAALCLSGFVRQSN